MELTLYINIKVPKITVASLIIFECIYESSKHIEIHKETSNRSKRKKNNKEKLGNNDIILANRYSYNHVGVMAYANLLLYRLIRFYFLYH